MKFRINGQEESFEVREDDFAIDVIRDMLKLTGTKQVCGQGVCGACTVLVNGKPALSCISPASHLENCDVKTIESFGRDKLHPIQKAFMFHDGLQCGYCTPGFIISSIAFYEDWIVKNGTGVRPDKKTIADALSGHLCRCGAYSGIYEAVASACAGAFDHQEKMVVPKRVDALEKVTGEAKFTTDIHFQYQLIGKILRSPHAHARVKKIDTELIESFPGVISIIQLLGPDRTVRYVGQPILAYAATDKYSAEQAMNFVRVEYEILEPVLTIEKAKSPKSPLVYSTKESANSAPNAGEGVVTPGKWVGNVRKPRYNLVSWRPRKAKRRIKRAAAKTPNLLVEGKWTTQPEIHTPLEPHVCVAKWESSRELNVFLSTQSCDSMSREIAKTFELNPDDVNVICRYVGGAFGSKTSLAVEILIAIRLSRSSDMPVRLEFDRMEEMTVGGYRPATEINLAIKARKNGLFDALSVTSYTNSGVAVSTQVGALMRFIYPGASKSIEDYDVVTNVAVAKPFRGPSGPQACWALEQAVDAMAVQLKKDPIELRKLWDNHKLRLELLDIASRTAIWQRRKTDSPDSGRYKRGVGVASGYWLNLYDPKSSIKVSISAKGISATTASQDMGNGTRTVIANTIATVFGIGQEDVIVNVGHSKAVKGPMSAGSRTTNSLYSTSQEAALMVRNKLMEGVKNKLQLSNPVIEPDGIRHDKGFMNWRGVFSVLPAISYTRTRGKDSNLDLLGMISLGADNATIGRGFTSAVYLAEVEVDSLLGKVRVLNIWGGISAGKIVIPELAKSQCHGAIIQGIGYALYEEKHLDPVTGKILTIGLEDYKIPGIGDVPEMELFFLESGFEKVKGRAAGLSEVATIPVAASIGNAVFNATGWQPRDLPIRPDRLLKGINSKGS